MDEAKSIGTDGYIALSRLQVRIEGANRQREEAGPEVQAMAVADVDPGKIMDELLFVGVVRKKHADLDITCRHTSIRARRAPMQEGSG